MRVVIARVLERARLEPVGSRPEAVVRRGVTMVPKTGTRVIVRARHDAKPPASLRESPALHA